MENQECQNPAESVDLLVKENRTGGKGNLFSPKLDI